MCLCACVCAFVCTCTCLCVSVLIELLLSHGLYSIHLWITAFPRLVWWTGLFQLTVYCYTIQLGRNWIRAWVAFRDPYVSLFKKSFNHFLICDNICITQNSQNVLSESYLICPASTHKGICGLLLCFSTIYHLYFKIPTSSETLIVIEGKSY